MRISPITLIIGAVALYAVTKGLAAKKLKVIASRAKNIKWTIFNVSFDLELVVQNFSDQNLLVTGLSGEVFINGNPVATTLRNTSFSIQKNNYSSVIVPTRIEFPALATALKQYIADVIKQKTSLSLNWKGTITSLGIPFNVETSFDVIA